MGDRKSAMLLGWLREHGVKVSALPMLVLVRDGEPTRSMLGADKILRQSSLHAFAFDDDTPPNCIEVKPRSTGMGFFSRVGARIGFARTQSTSQAAM